MDQTMIQTMAGVEDEHWWYVARREILLTAAGRHLKEAPTSLLDLGCGTGGNLAAFCTAFGAKRALGLDNQTACIEASRARGLSVLSGDLTGLPFADSEFDFVSALDVLEHVEDEVESVREIARVLQPGGMALVTVPAYQWLWGPHDDLNDHKRRYTRSRLVAALQAGGMEVQYVTYINCYLFPIAATARIIERVSGHHGGEDRLPPSWLNTVLFRLFRAERRLVARGLTLPYGLSVLAVAHRPGGAGAAPGKTEAIENA